VHPPQLEQYNAWGQRVDRLVLTPAWDKLKRIAAQEGLISIGYERAHGPWSRVHQIAKLYLFSPSAGLTTCPLAMTDGAAKTLEVIGDLARLFHHLLLTAIEGALADENRWSYFGGIRTADESRCEEMLDVRAVDDGEEGRIGRGQWMRYVGRPARGRLFSSARLQMV
jgi:hypothetical protein